MTTKKIPPPPPPKHPPRLSRDEVWKCKDGRRIEVQDLTEDHAKSILRMILQKRRKLRELKTALQALSQMQDWSDELEGM